MIRVSVWTAIFLIALRICIGWHFAYEGYGKVKSAYEGKAAINDGKSWSSEGFFRESETPFGRLVKKQLGDPDQQVVDRMALKPVTGDTSLVSPATRFPDALAAEWDEYFNRFVSQYRLDADQTARAQSTFDQAKATYVRWLQGQSDETDPKTKQPKPIRLKVTRKAPGVNNQSGDFDDEVIPVERAAELKKKSDELKSVYTDKLALMGRDVEGASLRTRKSEVTAIRNELQKEIDEHTRSMKDALAKLFDTRITAYATRADNKDEATTLSAMLVPMKSGTNPLATMWDEYAAHVKEFAPNISYAQKAEVDAELAEAKTRFDRWVSGQDPYTGEAADRSEVGEWSKLFANAQARRQELARLIPEPKKTEGPAKAEETSQPVFLPKSVTAVLAQLKTDAEAELKTLTSQMQSALKTRSDVMRAQVGTPLLGADRAKGYAAPTDERSFLIVPKDWTAIDLIDWTTRWFLLVVGVLLMVGLFTRLSCFAAAGFLLMTILTQPSVPWLPASPISEGNYLFVNKNVIEMVALLALMTTRSGKWAGLDSIVSWMFGGRRRAAGY